MKLLIFIMMGMMLLEIMTVLMMAAAMIMTIITVMTIKTVTLMSIAMTAIIMRRTQNHGISAGEELNLEPVHESEQTLVTPTAMRRTAE